MQDMIQSFQIETLSMRGRLVRLNGVLDKIIGQHNYPDWVGFALAETLLLNAAMASAIKLSGKLSLQIQSEGAIKLIATDFVAGSEGEAPTMRGYVKYDEERRKNGEPLLKNGVFGVLIDLGDGMQPYKGMSRLEDSITKSAAGYFLQSEQIPTVFHLDMARDQLAKTWHGGVIMVQQLAAEGGIGGRQKSEDDLRKIEALLGTVEREEMLSGMLSSEELLYRLFHEDAPTANPAYQVAFGCQCSEARVRQSLSIYSQKDLAHMQTDEGTITADCQFCGAHYVLDPATVGLEAEGEK